MVCIDATACWIATSLFNAAGLVATLDAWGVASTHKVKRLIWLVPMILISTWLVSAFGAGAIQPGVAESARLAGLYRQFGTNLIGWSALSVAFLWLRHYMPGNRKLTSVGQTSSGTLETQAKGKTGGALQDAMEQFLASVDSADSAAIVATYAPEFLCVRVADEGGFATLSREQMAAFMNRPGGHATAAGASIPTRETAIHHAEVIGDFGLVLLTRVKNLGNGWEPLFYTFMWRKQEEHWQLLREYVHQKSIPKWR